MTYTEFKAMIGRYVWRTGDVDFETDVDLMVLMAEARLGRELTLQRRETKTVISATDYRLTLPADFDEPVELAGPYGTLKYVTPADMSDMRYAADRGSFQYQDRYTVRDTIEVGGPVSASEPVDFTLTYRMLLPAYAVDGETWVQTKYRDVYTYAVLMETPLYLREDVRYAIWENAYASRLTSVLEQDARNKRPEAARLRPSMPGVVA